MNNTLPTFFLFFDESLIRQEAGTEEERPTGAMVALLMPFNRERVIPTGWGMRLEGK